MIRSWSFSNVVAVAALLISLIQFSLTTPILLDAYFKPELIVYGDEQQGGLYSFTVVNEGNDEAQGIEIGVITGENDRVLIMPNLGTEVTDNGSLLVTTHRVVIPYLSPGESVSIVIDMHADTKKFMEGNIVVESEKTIKVGPFPSVVYFRSKEGLGEINAPKFGDANELPPQT